MTRQQVDGLGRRARAGETRPEQDVPDLDDAVGGVDAHEREPPPGAARRGIDRGEEQRILAGGRLGEPGVGGGSVRKGMLPKIAPELFGFGTGARREEIVAMACRIERFEANVTTVKDPALGA